MQRIFRIALGALLLGGCATREPGRLTHQIFGDTQPVCRDGRGEDGGVVRVCETDQHVTVEKVEDGTQLADVEPLDIAPKPVPLTGSTVLEKLLAQSAAAQKGRQSGRPSGKIVLVCTI